MKNSGLIKGALIISAGTLFAKILGAFYRVPLTSVLGAEGIGIYQLVFPFYSILLTLSSTGIPSGLAKLISEGANAEKLLKKSLIIFGTIGFIGSLFMLVFAKRLSLAQGNLLAETAYYMLAPSVFIVSLLSTFRGYYQGQSKMLPTSLSQIIEQSVKLGVGLTLCSLVMAQSYQKAALAALAVTVSEIFAFIYVFSLYLYKKKKTFSIKTNSNAKASENAQVVLKEKNSYYLKENHKKDEINIKVLFVTVVPITLSVLLLPLARVIDSFLILNLISASKDIATAAYGVYTGGVESLIGVPVAICYGIAVAALPLIAKSKSKDISKKTLIYTLILSLLAAAAVYLLSDFAVNLLYRRLDDDTQTLMISLLKISAVQVVLLSLLQSASSVLIALNRQSVPMVNLFFGIIVKVLLTLLLVPRLGIYGTAISDIACYFVAVFFDLMYIKNSKQDTVLCRKRLIAARL